MVELETKKLLKVFGVAVTDFEDESQRMIQRATELGGSIGPETPKKFIELARDAVELIADLNAKWLEVTNYLQTQQRKVCDELVQQSQRILGSGTN